MEKNTTKDIYPIKEKNQKAKYLVLFKPTHITSMHINTISRIGLDKSIFLFNYDNGEASRDNSITEFVRKRPQKRY